MSRLSCWITLLLTVSSAAAAQCPPDSVLVGRMCADRYEASVWRIADTLPNRETLIAAIRAGMITDAMQLAGAQRRGENGDDFGNCTDQAGGVPCTKIYAVSIPGVRPSREITWFQAATACANSGKRLLTNQEWTVAALGTPDPGPDNDVSDCNSSFDGGADPTTTGARSACVSTRGAYDMAGNLWEWVADWTPHGSTCPGWSTFSNDANCLAGADSTMTSVALIRGGAFGNDALAGPFAVDATSEPSESFLAVGFRCGREL